MFGTFHKLKVNWKELTAEEAQHIHVNEPSIIVSGGYTNLHDGEGYFNYCAMGSLPGCLRSGPPTDFSVIKGPHYHINIRDLVKLKGFYPNFFSNGFLMRYQCNAQDYSVNFCELIKECVNCNLTDGQLKDSRISGNHFNTVLSNNDN